jgi:colicin import membrane protein
VQIAEIGLSLFPGETVNVRCSKSLYDLLEVNESASQEAIAANYKRLYAGYSQLATNGGEDATNQLIAIREAYSTLSNPERRRRYDEKLATRLEAAEAFDRPLPAFLKLLILVVVVGLLALGYGKYQSEQEKARLERERIIAATKAAELEAQNAREERAAADQAERQRRADEAAERNERARDIAYGNQVTRSAQYSEAQLRLEQQRAEQQRANAERQRVNEANRQLAKDKAYLRELEANSRRTSY